MEIRCLIVDDDEMSRVSLEKLIAKIPDIEIVGTCMNATQALTILEDEYVDVLLLDIQLPGLSGLDLVQSVQYLPYVIFVTSRADYALQAFEFKDKIIDFITKPVIMQRLSNALDRVRELVRNDQPPLSSPDLFIRSEGRIVRLDLNNLLYIETKGDYVAFVTEEEQFMVHSTLKAIDELLLQPHLMKVHRSFIINLHKIRDIEENSILLINKKIIPVSRQFKPLLIRRINPLG
ncbi:MAG TPA: LytTR family DNA-binding domain-containing protein [Saprospiraceae bacterium]|nr:response regulator transcription factor [Saprospiraceae bacterium]MCB9267950.1 response regulator transcription factor [Lewinellaceae bacterium]HPG07595.1 LytTR family DNA-binding domain-containing protein [Saprospiraceae bacterium]HPR00957.1 LytTR family DNA-binding domain-containing protein [Saprospiraceae bacterium]HRV86041.1 LytTR family DNA-binding domain-containing protein [Saprospiraceae bacterium]